MDLVDIYKAGFFRTVANPNTFRAVNGPPMAAKAVRPAQVGRPYQPNPLSMAAMEGMRSVARRGAAKRAHRLQPVGKSYEPFSLVGISKRGGGVYGGPDLFNPRPKANFGPLSTIADPLRGVDEAEVARRKANQARAQALNTPNRPHIRPSGPPALGPGRQQLAIGPGPAPAAAAPAANTALGRIGAGPVGGVQATSAPSIFSRPAAAAPAAAAPAAAAAAGPAKVTGSPLTRFGTEPARAKLGPQSTIADPLRGFTAEDAAKRKTEQRLAAQRSAFTHEKWGDEAARSVARRQMARRAAVIGGTAALGTGAVLGGRRMIARRTAAKEAQRAAVASAAKRARNIKIAGGAGAGLLALGALGASRRD